MGEMDPAHAKGYRPRARILHQVGRGGSLHLAAATSGEDLHLDSGRNCQDELSQILRLHLCGIVSLVHPIDSCWLQMGTQLGEFPRASALRGLPDRRDHRARDRRLRLASVA